MTSNLLFGHNICILGDQIRLRATGSVRLTHFWRASFDQWERAAGVGPLLHSPPTDASFL